MMHYRKMTKNYVFREYECGLSVEETANLCFKSVKQVKKMGCRSPNPERVQKAYENDQGARVIQLRHLESIQNAP